MKVGDYVRTEDGIITIIKMFYEKKLKEPELIYARFLCENYEIYEYPREVKSSPDIIDLIQEGDFVNGERVVNINGNLFAEDIGTLENIIIKSIVTKEQFKQMEYKVGDNDDK